MRTKLLILTILICSIGFSAQKVTLIESNSSNLNILVSVNPLTSEDLKPIHIVIGLPSKVLPELNIQMLNQQIFYGATDSIAPASIEWVNIQKLRGLNVGTLRINPGGDGRNTHQYYKDISISMNFDSAQNRGISNSSDDLLAAKVINWSVAQNWITSKQKSISKSISLPNGKWIKFEIENDGIYQITGSNLINILPEINNYDTRSFSLFTGSNLGRSQPQKPNSPIPSENIVEVAIQYIGSSDGTFSNTDKIIFHAQGASGFDLNGTTVSFSQNLYFLKNIYWLFIPDDNNLRGKRIAQSNTSGTSTVNLNYGIAFQHAESDLINPQESGLGWVEQSIAINATLDKSVDISNINETITPQFDVGFQGGTSDNKVRPSPNNRIAMSLNSDQSIAINPLIWNGMGQRFSSFSIPANRLINGVNTFTFTNASNDNYSQPYFDYLTMSYGRYLSFSGEPIEFYSPVHSNPIEYTFTATISPTIWDITNLSEPIELLHSQIDNNFSFETESKVNSLNRIMMFDVNNIPTIDILKYIENHNFANFRNNTIQANHIIIAPADYANIAEKYVKHRNNSIFVPIESIYDEFTGGNPDPMAIRNFVSWTQNHWQSPIPETLFIVGDADYDYRNISGNSNIIVPTIEVGITGSFATDDRLAALEGTIPEVALGRFPARSADEAEIYIDKLIEFETNPEYGLWRQRITLIADDAARPENTISELNIGKSHTINSEILADIIPASFETNKLYMLEFPEESDAMPFGVSKPKATSTLFEMLFKGTAIVNYIGHGSANQWAQERLLYQDRGDLQLIETGMKLPLWIAGTCSWGHFDDFKGESFSEELIRQPMNGASAIITTSRAITVTSNQYYEEQLFRNIFPNQTVSDKSIGIILQSIKTGNQEGEYFHLFGDPAMRLPLPMNNVSITSTTPDTLRTLGETSFRAEQNFTQQGGEGYVILNDAEREVTREYNYLSNIESLTYKMPGPTLFRGKIDFANTVFGGKLRIPKDISFSQDPSSLRIYIKSNDVKPLEAIGIKDSLFIKSGDANYDNFGPIIGFETIEKRQLHSGDHITDDKLLIRLTDPLGINLTGEIGHNIELTNLSTSETKIITDDFIYDNNSITTGTIPLQIDENETELNLSVKVWDSANNPANKEIKLHRLSEAKLKLFNVMNFPNPFSTSTQFTFELSQAAEISITIFTLGGRSIFKFEPEDFTVGFHTIDWDGRDAFGDELANGVYLYRLKAVSSDESASFIGKLAKYE